MNMGKPARRALPPRTPHRRSAIGGTLLGVFIGIVVGLVMAASVAYWLMKNNPALSMPSLTRDAEPAREAAKVARADPDKPRFDFYKILPGTEEPKVQADRRVAASGDRAVAEQAKDRSSGKAPPAEQAKDRSPARTAAADAPPGRVQEKSAVDPAARLQDKVASLDATPKLPKAASDRFWLQAGSFSSVPDAENLRARLALAGWEATVQEGALADKSIRYRVRLGPYDNPDELGRMKSELAKRGFDAAVIRN
jgi:cell division protein FtsN